MHDECLAHRMCPATCIHSLRAGSLEGISWNRFLLKGDSFLLSSPEVGVPSVDRLVADATVGTNTIFLCLWGLLKSFKNKTHDDHMTQATCTHDDHMTQVTCIHDHVIQPTCTHDDHMTQVTCTHDDHMIQPTCTNNDHMT